MSERNDSRHDSPRRLRFGAAVAAALLSLASFAVPPSSRAQTAMSQTEIGRPGGRITVALRTDPKTLNPILAVDTTSREVIGAMQADLVHINRQTQRTEPALAKRRSKSKFQRTPIHTVQLQPAE